MKNTKYIILSILLLGSILMAQNSMSARSIALSGAFATNSRGVNTFGWNPANLGYADNPDFSWRFFLLPPFPSASLELKNNSISPHWLHNKFMVGRLLNNQEKKNLLNYFPKTGFELSPIVNFDLLTMSAGNWAFSLGAESISNVQLPKPLFNFIFFGNQFDKPIKLDDTDLESQTLATFTVYHGRKLELKGLEEYVKELYVGGGIKFISGGSYVDIERLDAGINFTKDKAMVDGNAVVTGAAGGYGFALDLGASARLSEKIFSSLSFHNLGGKIHWGGFNIGVFDDEFLDSEDQQKGDIARGKFNIYSEIHKSNFDSADSLFEEGIKTDTIYTIDNYSSNYPTYMNFGFEYRLQENLKIMANYQQFFKEQLVFSTVPKISLAGEYFPNPVLPLRMGISIGGKDGFRWGFGSGVNLNNYTFDFGFSQIGGMLNRARGFSFSITSMLIF